MLPTLPVFRFASVKPRVTLGVAAMCALVVAAPATRAEPPMGGASANISASISASAGASVEVKSTATVNSVASDDAKAPGAPAVDEAAKSAAPPKPATTLVANVDLSKQQLTVLVNGKVRHQWPISSGRAEFPTPVGSFRPEWMAKMWYSKKYDDAPMPHAVFFKNGAAIHATNATGMLGRPASHGCVRLAPANAAQFYALVQSHGMVHSKIAVFGTPKFAPAPIARARDLDRDDGRVSRRVAQAPMGYGRGLGTNSPLGYRPVYGRPEVVSYGAYGSYGAKSANTGIFAPSGGSGYRAY
jgi:lipoprotein-anchoring transpeptidase ErfK/SrfK